jgi:hypothetical protein
MTSLGNEVLRPVTMTVLIRRSSQDADVATVAATARAAYDDLASVLVPLIGQAGFDAVTSRALYLGEREYPTVKAGGGTEETGTFAPVSIWLMQQDAGVAMDAAATILAIVAQLLVTFIGEPLTMRLLRKGWPDGFPDVESEEKPK